MPLHAGSLVFAIRQQTEEWSETVLSFRAGETEGAGTQAGGNRFLRLRGGLQRKLSVACLVMTVLSLLAGTGWFYTRQEREMNDVVRAMAGGTEKVTSFRGRDGKIYFLAETEGARNQFQDADFQWSVLVWRPDNRQIWPKQQRLPTGRYFLR